MAQVLANMVKQTSLSSGASTIALTGTALRPYQNFSAVLSNGDTTHAMVVSRSNGAWQAGVYSFADDVLTLQRFMSSSTGSIVSFGSGIKDVYIPPLKEDVQVVFDVDAEHYDADGDDYYPAILRAMTAASANGGGVVKFGPSDYTCRTRIDNVTGMQGVSFKGVRGVTKLRMVLSNFENGATSGLIRMQGSLGTAVALSQSVKRVPAYPVRAVSGSRSGTTVTIVGDVAHGLAVGDPIWTTGRPTTAQGVFFTVNPVANNISRTIPYIVSNVNVDGVTFSYTVANTGDTTLTATLYMYRAADVLIVPDTSIYTRLQDLMVRSAAYRTSHPGSSEQNHIGEFVKIARILNSTMLMLHTDVEDDYLTSDTAEVVPVNFLKGFAFDGIELIGKGHNAASGGGDRGIMMYLCDQVEVVRSKFTDVDQMGPYFWSCLNAKAQDNHIQHDAGDEAGESSGSLDIQYGIAYSHCTTGFEVSHNYVEGGRHACVQTGTSSALYHGVARHIHIHHNTFKGQWLGSISTHVGSDNITIDHNNLRGVQCGINPRFCRHLIMNHNNIDAYGDGILAYNYIEDLTIDGNTIRAGQYDIRITNGVLTDSPADDDEGVASGFTGPLKVINNQLNGGEHGIYIVDGTAGLIIPSVDVSGNSITGTKKEAIRITIGDITQAADGFYGKVSNNIITNCGLIDTSQPGIWLSNFKGGTCNNNWFRGPHVLEELIYVVGSGTGNGLSFLGNRFETGIVGIRPIAVYVGSWHQSDAAPLNLTSNNTVLVGDVATPILTGPIIMIDTEGAAATDDLVTLTAAKVGQIAHCRQAFSTRVVTVKTTGNIRANSSANQVLTGKTLVLQYGTSAWVEIAFITN